MPYEIFRGSSEPVRRAERPVSEWSIKDVITEFRAQYKAAYPSHSPDELGNFVRISKILGKLRKDHPEITVEVMHAAISTFWAEDLDKRRPDVPAWQKWIWKVRDTRPKREDEFRRTQTIRKVKPQPKPVQSVNAGPSVDQMKAKLAVLQPELEKLEALLEAGDTDELRLLLGAEWSTILNYKRDRVASLLRRTEEK